MKDFTIYLAGGMGKFGKENFDECNKWRVLCKREFEDYDSQYYVYVDNPNDYFNFVEEPRRYQSQREIMEFDLNKVRNADLIIINFNDIDNEYAKKIAEKMLDIIEKNKDQYHKKLQDAIYNHILFDYNYNKKLN